MQCNSTVLHSSTIDQREQDFVQECPGCLVLWARTQGPRDGALAAHTRQLQGWEVYELHRKEIVRTGVYFIIIIIIFPLLYTNECCVCVCIGMEDEHSGQGHGDSAIWSHCLTRRCRRSAVRWSQSWETAWRSAASPGCQDWLLWCMYTFCYFLYSYHLLAFTFDSRLAFAYIIYTCIVGSSATAGEDEYSRAEREWFFGNLPRQVVHSADPRIP